MGDVSREGSHDLTVVVWLRGTGKFARYRFDVESFHDFVLTGAMAPAIRVVVLEKPGELRLERRPTVEWYPNGGVGRPPETRARRDDRQRSDVETGPLVALTASANFVAVSTLI